MFFLDGEASNGYLEIIDLAIRKSEIKPIIVVSINNLYDSSQPYYPFLRTKEMLYNHSIYENNSENKESMNRQYYNFSRFIRYELFEWINENYNISGDYREKILFGCSNGGSFAFDFSIKNSLLFGSVISQSPGWDQNNYGQISHNNSIPNIYLSAGSYEKGFYENTINIIKCKKNNIPYYFHTLKTGHNEILWKSSLILFLKKSLKNHLHLFFWNDFF